jgi:hypothetical protein
MLLLDAEQFRAKLLGCDDYYTSVAVPGSCCLILSHCTPYKCQGLIVQIKNIYPRLLRIALKHLVINHAYHVGDHLAMNFLSSNNTDYRR